MVKSHIYLVLNRDCPQRGHEVQRSIRRHRAVALGVLGALLLVGRGPADEVELRPRQVRQVHHVLVGRLQDLEDAGAPAVGQEGEEEGGGGRVHL